MPDLRFGREHYQMMAEIKQRSRRMYQTTLKAEKQGILHDDELADLFIDARFVASYVDTLWRMSGETAREARRLAQETSQSPEIVQSSEDDPLA